MPGGRPTKYQPEFCETIQKVGADGGWLSQMAEACDVHRSTLDEWAKEHPQFSEALSRAKQKAQAKMEEMGFTGITADKFNNGQWKHMMAARHEEYRDKSETKLTGSVQVETITRKIVKPDA